ncbi:MAG: glutathione S-transferase family protein [Hyphomicrobiales bacterium]|nr:glutathione S-transferase family protein [Hyphomicrobiales bacterium]MDE2115758.1 glutathione S-transferase family protein [Hyphomicrobiales bacterium]
MIKLYHHPLCPHSRFARLALAEYGIEPELVEELAPERRHDFLAINPAGQTPVMVDEDGTRVPGAVNIAEYLDETRGHLLGDHRLMPPDPVARVEVRRLLDWFHAKFFAEVSSHLVMEKVYKRFLSPERGGGAPNMDAVRVARHNVLYHMAYIGYLTTHHNWLAGDAITYADLAAAAHLSSVDFLGDAPWDEDDGARHWYAMLKSRRSFRPLLADRVRGIQPSAVYADLDF